jgi:hypothetical protein
VAEFGRVGVHGVRRRLRRAVHHERRDPIHAAQGGRRLVRREKIPERTAVQPGGAVGIRTAARRRHEPEPFAAQRAFAGVHAIVVGPAGLQHDFHPLLQERRHAIPAERMQKDEQAGGRQPGALVFVVDVEIGICRVQVMHFDTGQRPRRLRQAAVDGRAVRCRVGIDHEDVRFIHALRPAGRLFVRKRSLITYPVDPAWNEMP